MTLNVSSATLKERYHSIGQVLSRLTHDFPELTPSKLRFLEEQGLICPARTPSGYRKFSGEDIRRVHLILSLQRDHYVPLKVILTYLTELDAGNNPDMPGGLNQRSTIFSHSRKISRAELLQRSGASAELLRESVSASLIEASDFYNESHLEVMKSLCELGNRGIEPRHLRGIRAAAEREVALIETALAAGSRKKEISAKAQALETAQELSNHLGIVRASVVKSTLMRNVS